MVRRIFAGPAAFLRLAVVSGAVYFFTGLPAVGDPADWPALDPAKTLRESERAGRLAEVQPGLSPDQVRRLIGPPRHVCAQILYHRRLEQWLYDAAFPVRLEFDCPRGQEPRLLSVQPLYPAKP